MLNENIPAQDALASLGLRRSRWSREGIISAARMMDEIGNFFLFYEYDPNVSIIYTIKSFSIDIILCCVVSEPARALES